MSYRLLKLVSDYTGSEGKYTNRLELGDSGLGGPVDIRFIDEAGWIENVHSVFFSVNGTDTYPSSGGKGKITTTKYTGELVFFDELNTSGRTLSQLGGGLWQVDGTETQLITADDIDMQAYGFIGLSSLKPSHVSGTTIFDVNDNLRGYLGTTSYALSANADINMGGNAIKDMSNVYMHEAGTWDTLSFLSPGGETVMKLVSYNEVYFGISIFGDLSMNGNNIVDADEIKGSLNADFSLYGSASDDLNFVKFLEWDHDTDRLSTQTETFTLGHGNTSASLSTGFYFYRGTTLNKEASMGWNELADRFEFMEEVGTPTLAEVLMQSLKIVSEPTNNKVGTIEMNDGTGNMEFTDENTTTKTLTQLAASGGVMAHSALTQLDFASAGHTGDLPMGGHDITELSQLFGKVESGFSWDLIFWGSNVGGSAAVEMMRWDASLQNINMAGKKIANLAAGTASGNDAARMVDLDSYYLKTAIDTWRNGVTQTEMGHVHGVTSDIQTQFGLYLPLSAESGKPLSGDLYMGGHDVKEISQLFGKVESGFTWDWIFYGSNIGGTAAVEMMRWDASLQNINMAGHKIANLGAGAAGTSDAARMSDLGSGGVTDHGALTGLADDDHSQYLLVAGTRAMTGDLDMDAHDIDLNQTQYLTWGSTNWIYVSSDVSGSDMTLYPDGDVLLYGVDAYVSGDLDINGALSKGSGSCLTTDIFYNDENVNIIRGMVCVSTGKTIGDRWFSKPITSVIPCQKKDDPRVVGVKIIESLSHTTMNKTQLKESKESIGCTNIRTSVKYNKKLDNLTYEPKDRRVGSSKQKDRDPTDHELSDEEYELVRRASVSHKGDRLHIGILGQYSKVLVDADREAIEVGDMLTTSPTIGHGMKSKKLIPGTLFGKALENKKSGKGYLRVLLSLN